MAHVVQFYSMKKVEAIIRSERMPVVKEKLRQMKIGGMTISTVSGWSKQQVSFTCNGEVSESHQSATKGEV